MSNLKRYDMAGDEDPNGGWVAFDDIKDLLNSSHNNARDAITLLETEIEFISGDCGSIDLGVVASKLNAVVALLRTIA